MSVMGEKYSVELERRKTHGVDWTVLKLSSGSPAANIKLGNLFVRKN